MGGEEEDDGYTYTDDDEEDEARGSGRPVGGGPVGSGRPDGGRPADGGRPVGRGPVGRGPVDDERPVGGGPVGGGNGMASPSDGNGTPVGDERPLGGFGGKSSPALLEEAAYPSPEALDLTPCSICGRTFAAARIEKHEVACRKASKKRKPLSASKIRLKGTEAASFYRADAPQPSTQQSPALSASMGPRDKPKWKAEHEEFIKMVRTAREYTAQEKEERAAPPPRVSSASATGSLLPCPHCSRKFSRKAAERHIPICARNENKPKPPPKENRYANISQNRNVPLSQRRRGSARSSRPHTLA